MVYADGYRQRIIDVRIVMRNCERLNLAQQLMRFVFALLDADIRNEQQNSSPP